MTFVKECLFNFFAILVPFLEMLQCWYNCVHALMSGFYLIGVRCEDIVMHGVFFVTTVLTVQVHTH